jgi:hypothetical protein
MADVAGCGDDIHIGCLSVQPFRMRGLQRPSGAANYTCWCEPVPALSERVSGVSVRVARRKRGIGAHVSDRPSDAGGATGLGSADGGLSAVAARRRGV